MILGPHQFRKILALSVFLHISLPALSQSISNVLARVDGSLVTVSYDLVAGDGDETGT